MTKAINMRNTVTAVVIVVMVLFMFISKAQTISPQDTIKNKVNKNQIENKRQQAAPDSIRLQTVPKTQQDSAFKRKRSTDATIYPSDSTQMK